MASAEFHLNNQNVLGKQMSLTAIVPDAGEGPFPVLYLLHGLSDNHNAWTQFSNIERHVSGLPLIIIMPNCERGFYCDNPSRPYANYETYITQEIVAFTDRTFRTVSGPGGRITAGLSMGGYGAAKFALKFPELFCAGASLSGALQFSHATAADARHLREFGPVVGENPTGGPNDLFALAERLPLDNRPPLFITCGVDDFLIESNRDFHRHLESINFPHVYQEHPGAHNWDYWDLHIRYSLEFLLPLVGITGFKGPVGSP